MRILVKKFICTLPVVALMMFGNSAFSQERWSLERCISHAMEHNLQIRQMEYDLEVADNNVKASKMEYLPSVNASMGHNMNWGRSVNLNDLEIVENKLSQSSSMNISAAVPVFDGLRKYNTIKSNKNQLAIAQANIETLKDDISIAIVKGYLQVLLSMEIEKAAQESCNSVAAQVETTAKLVEAGQQPYSSLLEVKAQHANENLQLTTARNNSSTALLELAQLLNLENLSDFSIEVPSAENIALPIEEEIDQIIAGAMSLPQMRKAELALRQSQLEYKIQKGAALPTLSLSAGYGTYYSNSQKTPFFTQFDNNRNPSIGLSLSIPIFNNMRNSTAIKNARANVEKSYISVEITSQEMAKQIRLAYNEAEGSYQKMLAAKANKEAAASSFEQTIEKFNLGMLNGTDYSTAKANLFKAESEYLQSKYQCLFQHKILDYYKNVPLTL